MGNSLFPTVIYDANDNQTSGGTRTVTYDLDGPGQMVQVATAAKRSAYSATYSAGATARPPAA